MKKIKPELKKLIKGYKLIWKVDRNYLLLQIVIAVTDALFPFVNLTLSAQILTELTTQQRPQKLFFYAAVCVIANFAIAILREALQTVQSKHRELFYARVSLFYSDINNTMKYSLLEDPETKFLRQRISQNENYLGTGLPSLISGLYTLIRSTFAVLFATVLVVDLFVGTVGREVVGTYSFVNSGWLTLILTCAVLLSVIINIWCDKAQKKRSDEAWRDLPYQNRLLNYYGGRIFNYWGAMDIRIFNQASLMERELTKYFKDPVHIRQLIKISRHYGVIRTLTGAVMNLLIYCYICIKVFTGLLGVGSFLLYTGAIGQFVSGISDFCVCISSLFHNNRFLDDILCYSELPSDAESENLRIEKPNEIAFHYVSFRYPGSKEYAIRDIDFSFSCGERIAVVGMNGSGKTTMIKLLCRLYEPTDGIITLNGTDIREYERAEYTRLLSAVFQDFKLFSFTIGQNVASSAKYDREKSEECLRLAGFGEKLFSLPHRLDTPLYKNFEEDGVEISGGEAQKIALARALYKKAPIFLLDEPTASLDPVAESEIYEKFNEIAGKHGVIFISHRLASCRFCSRILVFDEGKIVQDGNHETLISAVGRKYYELWNAQAKYYIR